MYSGGIRVGEFVYELYKGSVFQENRKNSCLDCLEPKDIGRAANVGIHEGSYVAFNRRASSRWNVSDKNMHRYTDEPARRRVASLDHQLSDGVSRLDSVTFKTRLCNRLAQTPLNFGRETITKHN